MNQIEQSLRITRPTVAWADAVEKKRNRLKARIFGIPTVRFEVVSEELVYVPYHLFVYEFEIRRRTIVNRSNRLDRAGKVAIIFDCNESHPFECDLEELGELDFEALDASMMDGKILPATCDEKAAREQSERYIQNKVLRRLYASTGDLTLKDAQLFYRPACLLRIRYGKSEVINHRFAYLDSYGVENEHILGLKVRIGG